MKFLHITALAMLLAGSMTGSVLAGAGAPGHHHAAPGEDTAFGKPGNPKLPARVVKPGTKAARKGGHDGHE